jgi:hypothetical protein
MIRVCMFCDIVFGEKEPLHDKTPTHGICIPCFEKFRAMYENEGAVQQEPQNLQATQIELPYGQGESIGRTDMDLPIFRNVLPSAG